MPAPFDSAVPPTPEQLAQMQALAGAQPAPLATSTQGMPGTPMTAADVAREQQLLASGPVSSDAPAPAAPTVAPSESVAPGVQQPTAAGPQQYVSDPARGQDPFAVVGTLPGGTSTTTSRTDLGKAGKVADAAREKAFETQAGAIDKQGQAMQTRAAAEAETAGARVKALDQYAAQEALNAQAATERNNAALADLKKSQEDYTRQAAELGPDKFWQNQSTGKKVGNLIAIALSGLGQVFSAKGGNVNARNGALDMINLAIDRDIDMQKTALAASERGVRIKENAYMMARQAGADEAQATALAKASSLAKVQAEGDARVAKAGNEEATARWEQMRGQLEQQKAAELSRVAEIQATRTQSTTTSTPLLAGQVQAQQAAQQGLVPYDAKMQTPFGQATDAESKRELAKAHLAFKGVDHTLKQMEVLQKRGGKTGNWTPKDKATFETLRTDLMAFAKGDYGAKLGVLTGPDLELLQPQIPTNDAWDAFTGRSAAVLGAMKEKVEIARQAMREGYTVRTRL